MPAAVTVSPMTSSGIPRMQPVVFIIKSTFEYKNHHFEFKVHHFECKSLPDDSAPVIMTLAMSAMSTTDMIIVMGYLWESVGKLR